MKFNHSILAFSLLLIGCGAPVEQKNTVTSPNKTKQTEQKQHKEQNLKSVGEKPLKDFNGEMLAFYNVENLFDTKNDPLTKDEDFLPSGKLNWTEDRYNFKLQRIAEVTEKLKGELPVFMGMVEVENKQVVKDLITTTSLKTGNYDLVHKDSPDRRGIDVALIYRKDFAKLKGYESLNVDLGDVLTRDILYAKFELKDQEVLHVFVNHWPSRRKGQEASEYKRLKAANVLKAKTDKILKANPKANIVIMGDFNDYPDNKSLKSVLKAGTDTRKLYNLAYKPHKSAKDTKRGSHSYKGVWGMLDQIIISPNMMDKHGKFAISQSDFDVFYRDFLIFQHPKYKTYQPNRTYAGPKYIGGYSDHLPVFVEL